MKSPESSPGFPATLLVTFISLATPLMAADHPITAFDSPQDGGLEWRIVDDGVMGGLSRGNISFPETGIMRFAGTLSLENNGGFSSVRTGEMAIDLHGQEGIAVRVKGDGRTYQLRVNTDARYRSWEVSFKADFATREGEWTEVRIPFTAFVASFRGRLLPDVKFDPAKIVRLGLLLGDKKPGAFQLDVDWIRAYGPGGDDAKSPSQ